MMGDQSEDALVSRLLVTFADEARERLQAMNRIVLILEQVTDEGEAGASLEALFREAHSLKGAARAVSLESVERLAHRLETFFEGFRTAERAVDSAACDAVYRVLDALAALVEEAASGVSSGVDVTAVEGALDQPEGGRLGPGDGSLRAGPAYAPSHAPAPVPTPAPPTAPAGETSPAPTAPAVVPPLATDTIRTATGKLDAILAGVGELTVSHGGARDNLTELRDALDGLSVWEARRRKRRQRARQSEAGRWTDRAVPVPQDDDGSLRAIRSRLQALCRMLDVNSRRTGQIIANLEEDVRSTRMVPVATILDGFPRMVRDLARAGGKEVALIIEGADTEVDRGLLQQLRAPITHLLRNAVDHGLERPDVRTASGKSRQGTIHISASHQGSSLSIKLADDGGGIDVGRVRASAVTSGLLTAQAANSLSDDETIALIFRSGLSTAPIITDLSGRGVGMDAVRDAVEAAHGMIEVESRPGEGTCFRLTLPLAVSTTRCLILVAAGLSLALPVSNVVRLVRVDLETVEQVEGGDVLILDGHAVSLIRLDAILGARRPEPRSGNRVFPAVVLGTGERQVAFAVDGFVDIQEVVTTPFPPPWTRVRHFTGATILGTGQVVPILNAAEVLRTAARGSAPRATPPLEVVEPASPTILVADDSITTRTLERSILEAAGYQVRTAADGLEAWEMLQRGGYALLVCDVQMPGLDGFELTARIRVDEQLGDLAVVLVTSLDSQRDRERGVNAGADAYIVKGGFEQEQLLDVVRQLV